MSKFLMATGLWLGMATALLAQQSTSPTPAKAVPKNIFEALEGEAPGQGHVVIYQSEELRRLVGVVSGRYGTVLGREGNTSLLMGYRIQFFSGNRPSSKAEAHSRAALIRQLVPEYNCYISFNAPFWRLVVGDFLSMSQAREVRNRLLGVLPAWSKESYVIKDKVRILNYDPSADE
ncbi:MAG: SPOR domain-containing protein [Porphyromonadaceae bacterium]|nr:SPOR domain-containing protein [Porphyromonadaceae bacterium]